MTRGGRSSWLGGSGQASLWVTTTGRDLRPLFSLALFSVASHAHPWRPQDRILAIDKDRTPTTCQKPLRPRPSRSVHTCSKIELSRLRGEGTRKRMEVGHPARVSGPTATATQHCKALHFQLPVLFFLRVCRHCRTLSARRPWLGDTGTRRWEEEIGNDASTPVRPCA